MDSEFQVIFLFLSEYGCLFIIISPQMSEFQLWFAYYDSRFLMDDPQIPLHFACQKAFDEETWPNGPCRELSQALLLLETFMKNQETWRPSLCTDAEIQTMGAELNRLLFFLQIQKHYANKFWDSDPRRVQASVTHLYFFLQQLVKSLIPCPQMNLFELKACNKLCFWLQKLQEMFSGLLKKINSMAKYLSHPKFKEQSSIVYNFFQNLTAFMKKAPTIRRDKLPHIHNLTKYVILTNPIEISRNGLKNVLQIRKKSNTLGQAPKDSIVEYAQQICSAPRKKIISNDHFRPRRSKSHFHFHTPQHQDMQKKKEKFPMIFRFQKKLLSSDGRSTKASKTSMMSPKFLLSKVQEIRRLKTTPNIESPKKSKSLLIVKIQDLIEKRKIFRSIANESQKSSNPKRKLSCRINLHSKEQERKQFSQTMASTYYPRVAEEIVAYSFPEGKNKNQENKIEATTGKPVNGKGWNILREYFWRRVQQRKIRKILEQGL